MADTILVVAEQREGKLNRASFETIAAAQSIAKETGWQVEVVLPGSSIAALAQELAQKAVARVYALEGASLAAYTSDAYVFALKQFIHEKQPKLVLFPHTYQVRDFAPRLALALDRALISDSVGYKHENGKLLLTRRGWPPSRLARSGESRPRRGRLRLKTLRPPRLRRALFRTRSFRKRSRRLTCRRPRSLSQWDAVSRSRKTSLWPKSWPRCWAERSPLRAPSATTDGYRLNGRLAPRARRSRRSSTLR